MFHGIRPGNAVFVILSFEGPDIYSQAGGLGVRVTELSRALAQMGHETHLFFVGDPGKPGHEVGEDGRWHLHRWCQWISANHRGGVYDGEDEKLSDVEASLPAYVADEIIRPAIMQDKVCVILAEEWHTATTVVALHHLLRLTGMRERCIMFWNANNTFGFWRIPWQELGKASTITTVSKYMKHKMWDLGLNSLVIPKRDPVAPAGASAGAPGLRPQAPFPRRASPGQGRPLRPGQAMADGHRLHGRAQVHGPAPAHAHARRHRAPPHRRLHAGAHARPHPGRGRGR